MASKKAKQAPKKEGRRNLFVSVAIVVFSAALLLGALLLQLGGEGTSRSDQEINRLLAGIPQDGIALGDPEAATTLIEWGDMQCPACAAFAKGDLVDIINDGVRPGLVRIEFRQWPLLGPDSARVGKAALAASLQGRYWQFIEYFYTVQGEDISEELLEDVARRSGVADIDQWQKDRQLQRWEEELLQNDQEALDLGFSSTPSFAFEKNGRTETLDDPKEIIEIARG